MNNSVKFSIKAREVLEHETDDRRKRKNSIRRKTQKRKALLWGEWNTEFVVVLTKKKKGDENWQCVYVFLFLHFFSSAVMSNFSHMTQTRTCPQFLNTGSSSSLCSELHFSLGLIKVARRHIFTFHTPFVHVLEFFLHLVVFFSGENLQVAARSSAREVF